jgi:hypothetical protein
MALILICKVTDLREYSFPKKSMNFPKNNLPLASLLYFQCDFLNIQQAIN